MICTLQGIAVFVYLKKKQKNGNIVIDYVYYY